MFYGPHNVRLTQCPNCRNFADKYVEHDAVIMIIDLILIKPQIYRHLLFNRYVSSPKTNKDQLDYIIMRLGFLFTLFDVYLTWARVEKRADAESYFFAEQSIIVQYTFFLALCISGTLALHIVARNMAKLILNWDKPNALSTAILISSSIKISMILMVIWDYDMPVASRVVGWAVTLNNIEAMRILLNCSYWNATIIALTATFAQYVTMNVILAWILDPAYFQWMPWKDRVIHMLRIEPIL